jgi:hypothetical protein
LEVNILSVVKFFRLDLGVEVVKHSGDCGLSYSGDYVVYYDSIR